MMANFLSRWFRRKATIEDVIRYYDSKNATVAGVNISESSAISIAAVYACSRIICEAVGQTPLVLYKRDRDGFVDEDFNNDLYPLLAVAPNSNETIVSFLENLVHNQLFSGKAFTYVTVSTENEKRILEFIPINPNRVRIDRNPDTLEPEKFTLLGGSRPDVVLNKSHLIFHRAYREVSLLQAARNSMSLLSRAEQHEGNVLAKGAALRGILKITGRHSPSELVRRGKDFDESTSGANSGGTIALGVDEDYSPISMSNSDMQLIESRKLSKADICAAFRVPLYMVTGEGGPINMESEARRFYVQALGPIYRRIELDISNYLIQNGIRPASKFRIKFNTDPYLLGDAKTQAYVNDTLIKNGSMSPDEVRRSINFRPRPDGKGDQFVDITELNTGLTTTSGTQIQDTPSTETGDNPDNQGTLNGNQ